VGSERELAHPRRHGQGHSRLPAAEPRWLPGPPRLLPGQVQHDEQPHEQEHDDAEELHPAGHAGLPCTGGRIGGRRLGQLLLLTGARGASYRHFADVDEVLTAWHERQVAGHLQQLTDVRDRAGSAGGRLEAVLTTYAELSRHPHGSEAAARLHSGDHMAAARGPLRAFLAELVAEDARAGQVRGDVPAEELPTTSWGALSAAGGAASPAAVGRLIAVTLAALRAPV
jgi:hypothetical protein